MIEKIPIEKYFFIGLLGATGILVLVIFFPYVSIIILGLALAILLYPAYIKIKKHTPYKSEWLASTLTILCFLIVLGIPLVLLSNTVFKQLEQLYTSLTTSDTALLLSQIQSSVHGFLPEGITFDIKQEITRIIASLSSNIQAFLSATVQTIFKFLLVILTLFYFLKDGERIRARLVKLSPLKVENTEKILSTYTHTVNGVLKGYIAIALAQGILMGVGLRIFGVPHSALWGTLAGIASLIPMIGTAMISIPAIGYLIITGSPQAGLGMAVWAATLVGTIDNVLNPFIVGKQTALPPLVILFAILGGLTIMGPIGILFGPIAVSLFKTLVGMYRGTETV